MTREAPGRAPESGALTTEKISTFLGRSVEEVEADLANATKRQQLLQDLMRAPGFTDRYGRDQAAVERRLDRTATMLQSKKGFLRKSIDAATGIVTWPFRKVGQMARWAWNNPKKAIFYTALAAAGTVAATGAAFYLAGQWELFLANSGLNKVIALGKSAAQLIGLTPAVTGAETVVPGGTTAPGILSMPS